MFHVYRHPLFIAMTFQVSGDLKSLPARRAPQSPTGFNGYDFGAMFGQQTSKRRPDDAGGETENSNTGKRK
jgi:hypothetical protein